MRKLWRSYPLRMIILISWLVLALVLTTQSGEVPLVHLMTTTIGSTEWGGALGHAGLFAVLTLALYLVLSLLIRTDYALVFAVLVGLVLGAATEAAQMLVADRAVTLVDLLANWLGVFVVGFCVMLLDDRRQEKIRN
ncbi:MAG: VanZ family protein [Anaerolineae bacterium]|nr:VanZ family protein [Anaerolineae bacterium]